MKPILEVHNLGKKYRISHQTGGYLSLRERLSSSFRFRKTVVEDFWALSNVSFDVQAGESIGIIGRNGAGKSTLLKILSKITPPTEGKIITRGRIASLLEVGTGFHPELTGRENIFFNGSLLGMKHKEILTKFDEIVDFSGVERFLDTPLKHYSSGMQLRLAFSVAAFLEPEILIIDEVLAVGDAEFQKKCLIKMEDVSHHGRTILFVSHNMSVISNLCHRGLILDHGKVERAGLMTDVIRDYQGNLNTKTDRHWKRKTAPGRDLYFDEIDITLTGEQPKCKLIFKAVLKASKTHDKAFLAIDFTNSLGHTFMQALPKAEPFLSFSTENQCIEVTIQLPPLVPDTYYLSAWLGSHYTHTYDQVEEAVKFEIEDSPSPDRNFPHAHNHGVIVPVSEIILL